MRLAGVLRNRTRPVRAGAAVVGRTAARSFTARSFLASAAAVAVLAGCGAPAATPPNASGATSSSGPSGTTGGSRVARLTILAAASLRDVLETAATRYEATHPGASITLSTDSSAALAAQIEQGAPADLFLSADTKTPQALVDDGLAGGPVVPFARNTLAVIVPVANEAAIRTPADLARPGVRVVAAGDAVPITTYARRLVGDLATQPGYPADFAARYAANVVSEEDNVSAVLAKVELGEADAAIVYSTDAAASSRVRTVPVPSAADVIATYGAVIPTGASDAADARVFLDWLLGPDGQAILASAGFLPPAD